MHSLWGEPVAAVATQNRAVAHSRQPQQFIRAARQKTGPMGSIPITIAMANHRVTYTDFHLCTPQAA